MSSEMSINRRNLLLASGALIAVAVGASIVYMTPREAAKSGAPLGLLSAQQKLTLEAFGEHIVPGSKAAGMVHFIDSQLSADPNDCLLMLKYFQIPPPYSDFYSAGCRALGGYCEGVYGAPFTELNDDQKTETVQALVAGRPDNWQGPPAFLFYMFVRSDGVDVTYGTPEGFEALDLPFAAHIMPPKGWTL